MVLVAACLTPAGAFARDGKSLADQLEPLIQAHEGQVAIAVRNLKTGETYEYKADAVMPTASLIKFPVMVEAYRQAAEGKIDLKAMITLKEADKVPGSGILTDHFTPGLTLSLRDAIRLMIVYSDNTATNLVLDAIGLPATAETMAKMGFPETKIHSKVYRRDTSVFPDRSKQYGLGSTTPQDMVALFEKLEKRELISPEASEAMLGDLLKCDDTEKFPRYLPAGTKIAFKTGSIDASRTCAGIIYTPDGPVAACVMTSENKDQSWAPDNAGNLLCAKVAREVFEHYSPEKPSESPPAGQ
jgi:beta-lactamase class A